MNEQLQMAIIANDLDSLMHRIEALRAHPKLTDAQTACQQARDAIRVAAVDIHHSDMAERYDI